VSAPLAVIGVPMFNKAAFLRESLESILAQTYPNLRVVVIDDGSRDESFEVATRYADIDPRVTVRRYKQRRGMIANWAACYKMAKDVVPDLKYFAWGSDHDLWHPAWLATLVAHLESHPEAALAYPLNLRISETGEVERGPWHFETRGMADVERRLRAAIRGMSAGNMVYGLFRAEALERAGVFQRFLLPDRLVLTRLALYGEFHQVDRVLWFRRFSGLMSLSRQRRSFFPVRGGGPIYTYAPWWLTHSVVFFVKLVLRPAGQPFDRSTGVRLWWAHLQASAALEFGRSYRYTKKWIALKVKNLRHVRLRRTRRRLFDLTRPLRHDLRGRVWRRLRGLPPRSTAESYQGPGVEQSDTREPVAAQAQTADRSGVNP
jgi:glycosyltransferase involved in cell wall biosynthesis